MATTDRPRGADASEVATACGDASLVHVLARADGDALAAASILAAACEDLGTPYHVATVRTRAELDARIDAADDAATPIVVGAAADPVAIDGTPASVDAYRAARALGASPDPVTPLAGVVAAGEDPEAYGDALLDGTDLEREPGVAIPTADPIDGLAHTTLVHAAFSGDRDAVPVDPDAAAREIASMVALAVTGAGEASTRSATAVERVLRPYVGGPLETVGGYADVLEAIARRQPGLGVALGLRTDVSDAAREIWRERSRAIHDGVREATTARYDGLVVARTAGPVEPVARLVRDFRSPEPAVLAVSDDRAALATVDADAAALERAVDRTGGSALVRERRGYARVDADAETLSDAVLEEL